MITSPRLFTASLLSVVLLSGCLRQPPGPTADELTRVGWYIEDASRGIDRSPLELVTADMSPELEPVVTWLAGTINNDTATGEVSQITQRRQRFTLLKSGMTAGLVIVDTAGRLSTLPPASLPDPFNDLLPEAVRAENQDRLELASVLLGHLGWQLSDQRAINLLWQWQQLQMRRDRQSGALAPEQAAKEQGAEGDSTTSEDQTPPARRWDGQAEGYRY